MGLLSLLRTSASAAALSTEYSGLSKDSKVLTLSTGSIITFNNPIVVLPRGDGIYDVLGNPKVWKIVPTGSEVRAVGEHTIVQGNYEVEISEEYVASSYNIEVPNGYVVKTANLLDDHRAAVYEDCKKLVAQYSAQSPKLMPHNPCINPTLDDIAAKLLVKSTKLNMLNRDCAKAVENPQDESIINEVQRVLFGKLADNPDDILRMCNEISKGPFSKLSLDMVLYGINELKRVGADYKKYLDFKTWALNHGADLPFKLDKVFTGKSPNAINIIIDSNGNPISIQTSLMTNFFSMSEDGKALLRGKINTQSGPGHYIKEETNECENILSVVNAISHDVVKPLIFLSFNMPPSIVHIYTSADMHKALGKTIARTSQAQTSAVEVNPNAKIIHASGVHCNIYKLSFIDDGLHGDNELDVSERGVYVKNLREPKPDDFVKQPDIGTMKQVSLSYGQTPEGQSYLSQYDKIIACLVAVFPQEKDWCLQIAAKRDFLSHRHPEILRALENSDILLLTAEVVLGEAREGKLDYKREFMVFKERFAMPIEEAVASILQQENVNAYAQDPSSAEDNQITKQAITPARKALDWHGKVMQDEVVRNFIKERDIDSAICAIRDHGGSIALAVNDALLEHHPDLFFIQILQERGVDPLTNLDVADTRIKDAVLKIRALSSSLSSAAAASDDNAEDQSPSDVGPHPNPEDNADHDYEPTGHAHQHDQ